MATTNLDNVQEIISRAHEEIKSVEVSKDIALENDIGNLTVMDKNELNKEYFESEELHRTYLKDLTRECIQHLLNNIYELPKETINNMVYVTLPKPTTRLPREKKVPKPKEPTKWELYSREKGISKKKRGNKVWDDILKDWIPRYGFKKAQAEREKNWVREVPDGADPYIDLFAKAADEKKENVARNEYNRLRNLAKKKNITVPKVGLMSAANAVDRNEVKGAIQQARVSTASLGKFQPLLRSEKPLEEKRGKKRKVISQAPPDRLPTDYQGEKKRTLEVLEKVHRPDLDLESAVNKQITKENIEMSHTGPKKSARRSKMGKKRRGKSEHKALARGMAPYGKKKKKNALFAAATASTGMGVGKMGKGQRSKSGSSKSGGPKSGKTHIKNKKEKGRKRR